MLQTAVLWLCFIYIFQMDYNELQYNIAHIYWHNATGWGFCLKLQAIQI